MASMTEEFSKLINDNLYTPKVYSDVTDALFLYISTMNNYIANGEFGKLSAYYNSLSDSVKNQINSATVTAYDVNRIEEETRNVEIFAVEGKQSIWYQKTKPTLLIKNDVWIGD